MNKLSFISIEQIKKFNEWLKTDAAKNFKKECLAAKKLFKEKRYNER